MMIMFNPFFNHKNIIKIMSQELQSEIQALRAQLQKVTAEKAAVENQVAKLKANTAERIECYLGNMHELSVELAPYFADKDGDGKVDVIPVLGWAAVVQAVWNKIKENAKECHGKDIVVKLPTGWVGFAINTALGALGIKL